MFARRPVGVMLTLGLMLAFPIAATTAAQATATYMVQAGAVAPEGSPAVASSFEYTKYYPTTIQVNQGDTVHWNFFGFHSVAFLPSDSNIQHPAFVRTDEVPGVFAANEPWIFGGDCGTGTQDACPIADTASLVRSGIQPAGGFSALMNLAAGTYRYHCTVYPNMHGYVQVVAGTPSNPTQAAIDAQIADDTTRAKTLYDSDSVPSSTVVDGKRVWTVYTGDAFTDSQSGQPIGGVAINAYMPTTLSVGVGDEVQYVTDGALGTTKDGFHTVTFPQSLVGDHTVPSTPIPDKLSGLSLIPACDPDGVAGRAPGIPYMLACPAPASFELLLSPLLSKPHPANANAIPLIVTYHDSGLMVPPAAPDWLRGEPLGSGMRFPTEFTADFPRAGGYSYACVIHGTDMAGTINVG